MSSPISYSPPLGCKNPHNSTVHFANSPPQMAESSSTAARRGRFSPTDRTPLLLGDVESQAHYRDRSPPIPLFRHILRNLGLFAALTALGLLFGTIVIKNKTRPLHDTSYMASGRNGVVSCDVEACSDVGVDVLRDGGTAVDAVIATAVCIGAVNMFASGPGGGGFMVVRMADGESKSFNFRERAPASAHKNMYNDRYDDAKVGGLAVGVPGEVHGFMAAHREYGKAPWKSLWTSSAELMRRGYPVTPVFKHIMGPAEPFFKENKEDWEFLFRNDTGALVDVGDFITRPLYAATLERIGGDGSGDGYSGVHDFYNGTLAADLIATIQRRGGIITAQDMAEYFTSVTETSKTTFLGHEIATCPPPCSGHSLLQGLNLAELLPMQDPRSIVSHHYLVESMKHLSAGRTELGDPADPAVRANRARIAELISKPYADELSRNVSAHRTYPWEHYNPRYESNDPAGTSHISAIDRDGNAASLTSTVNLYWGARVIEPNSGIILNSQMDDFSIPARRNSFGLAPSVFNYISPGKRPLSSSAPAIVSYPDDGGVRLVLGASGGSRIVTGVFETVIKNLVWRQGLVETVKSPRMHHQLLPEWLQVEAGVEAWKVEGLRRMGHDVRVKGKGEAGSSVLHLLGRTKRGGRVRGVADWWRKGGKAKAY